MLVIFQIVLPLFISGALFVLVTGLTILFSPLVIEGLYRFVSQHVQSVWVTPHVSNWH